MFDVTYESTAAGPAELTISGGKPGPHHVRVRALPSGHLLHTKNWVHAEGVAMLLPPWADKIGLQIDKDPATDEWLHEQEVKLVPLEDVPAPKRKKAPPKVAKLAKARAAQHKAAERPHETTEQDVEDALENEPEAPDIRIPVTAEEKAAEHMKAEFPTGNDVPPVTDIQGTAPERAEKAKEAEAEPPPPLRTEQEILEETAKTLTPHGRPPSKDPHSEKDAKEAVEREKDLTGTFGTAPKATLPRQDKDDGPHPDDRGA